MFCAQNILTEGMILTQLSSNVQISVQCIVCVTTNCRFMNGI